MSTDTTRAIAEPKLEEIPARFHFEEIDLRPVTRAAGDGGDAEIEPGDSPAADGPDPDVFHVVISTETPCESYMGPEVLSHARSAIDMTLAKNGLSLYLDHGGYPFRPTPDPAMHIGTVENIKLVGTQLEGDIRFSRHELAQTVKRDVKDKTRKYISVRAKPIKRKVLRAASPDEAPTIVQVRWRPEEVSIVGIPADPNAAVARSAGAEKFAVETEYEPAPPAATEPQQEVQSMSEQATAAAPAAPAATPAPEATAPVSVTRSAAPAADILTLCSAHGVSITRAQEFVAKGFDLDQARTAILNDRTTRGAARQPAAESVDLSEFPAKDRRRYSVRRAILRALEVKEGRGSFDGLEGEVHAHIARQAEAAGVASRGGYNIPLELTTPEEREERAWAITRAMGSNQAGGGAELVFDVPRDPIEILSNKMLTRRFGANVLTGLVGNVPLPVQTGDPTAYLIGENPASAVSQSQLNFATRNLTAKEAVASVLVPRRLLNLASFNVENMIRNRIFAKHALLWDYLGMFGRGTDGEPQGVWYTSGVGSVAFGGVPTFAKFVDLESAVTDANVESMNMAYITTPGMVGKCKQTPIISGAAAGFIFTGQGSDGTINGYRAGGTKQVLKTLGGSSDEHGILFGDWSALTFGYWGAMEFIVDNLTAAAKGQIIVTSNELCDVVLDRPEAFAIGTGAKIA